LTKEQVEVHIPIQPTGKREEAQHGITLSKLRKIGADHASRIHGIENYGVMNDSPSCNCLKASQKNQSKYKSLNDRKVTDKGLCAIARSYHKLEYLNISYHTKIIGISICDIIHSCPRLQHFEFSYCKFTNEIIKEIANSCLNLKYLKLEGCDNVSKEAISQLISPNPNIHVENFVCTITPASFGAYPRMYHLTRKLKITVDTLSDIKTIHEYVNDKLRRMGRCNLI
ncbi:18426_t:CDS:2, partial [Funneliformis geosporum]